MTGRHALPPQPRRRGAAGLALIAAVGAFGLVSCSASSTPARVATQPVRRATLEAGVSAKGALAASKTANLGFPSAGMLTGVGVKVGDHVKAGQVLATLDNTVLKQLLAAQKGALTQAQAAYDKASNSPAVDNAQSAADSASTVAKDTKNQVSAAADADDVAISNAQTAESKASDAVNSAQSALKSAQAACAAGASNSCSAVATAQTALATAKQGLTQATAAVAAAEAKKQVDAAAGKTSVASAKAGASNAQNAADAASSDLDYGLQQLQGAVDSATAQVNIAQHNLDMATLKAPFDGTVTAVNGEVGEYVTPSTGTSALAPGSDAAIPGTNAGSAAASAVSRPGGTQLVVLSGTGPLQAVVPFQEMDAAQIVAGQPVALTFDALPDLQATGTVTSIAPAGTALSGSMSYYATISVDSADPRLKEGLSVAASVHTVERKDVLTVPNSAVHAQDGKEVVTVVAADGTQKTVTFTPGLVGPDSTEVAAGLNEGDEVVVTK